MKVFTSAGSSSGGAAAVWSVSAGPAAALGPRPGAGLGGLGERMVAQMASPDTRSSPNTERPAVVTCQPPVDGAAARPSSWKPHSEQNFPPGVAFVPRCRQNRAGIAATISEAAAGQKGGPAAASARPGRLAPCLAAHALEILPRHCAQRRIAPQEQDETARDRQRELLDPEAEVADQ